MIATNINRIACNSNFDRYAHHRTTIQYTHKVLVVAFYCDPQRGPRLLVVRDKLTGEYAPISGTVDIPEDEYTRMDNKAREQASVDAAIRESFEETGIKGLVRLDPTTTTRYFYQVPFVKTAAPTYTSASSLDSNTSWRSSDSSDSDEYEPLHDNRRHHRNNNRKVAYSYRVFFTDLTNTMIEKIPKRCVASKGLPKAMSDYEAELTSRINNRDLTGLPARMTEIDGAMFVSLADLRKLMDQRKPRVIWDQFDTMIRKWSHFESYFAKKLPNFASTKSKSAAWPKCPTFIDVVIDTTNRW
jgi:8-oxo-dGTP pyrophosphatase MutT (NUDIX family)